MPLTAARIRSAEPAGRPYKLTDGQGLHLYVAPTGRRTWRMAFRYQGREQLLTIGPFPAVSLGQARDRRDDARQLLRSGVNPASRRGPAQDNQALTFAAAFTAWHEAKRASWSEVHADDVRGAFERHLLPELANMPICQVDAPRLLEALRQVERSGSIETARRLRQWVGGVYRRAIAEKRATDNPAAAIADALAERPTVQRHQALLEEGAARAAYAAIAAADAPRSARLAALLVALTAVRCACARSAHWGEFEQLDGSEPTWRIPASRMKLKRARKADAANDHVVPLSRQAAELLRVARLAAGGSGWAFPARGGDWPIGENAIYAVHQAAGLAGSQSPHGWRASFSTIMNERDAGLRGAIELALAHAPKDQVEAAYNRAQQIGRRRELMQAWADLVAPIG